MIAGWWRVRILVVTALFVIAGSGVARAATPLPSGFFPTSFSFPTARFGWMLGDRYCRTASVGDVCVRLERTVNGGHTWSAVHLPAGLVNEAAGEGLAYDQSPVEEGLAVTFADQRNGWIYGALVYGKGQRSPVPTVWSTHDGGRTWRKVQIDGVEQGGATLLEVQTVAATAYAIVADEGNGRRTLGILRTAITTDRWRPDRTQQISLLAPFQSGLYFDGSDRFVVVGDTEQAVGARFTRSGWVPWPYPCASVGSAVTLPAVTASGTMYAACRIVGGPTGLPAGAPTGSASGQVWLYASTDHGTSFLAVGAIPVPAGSYLGLIPGPIATPSGGILLGINHELLASFDGGRTWTPAWNQQPTAIHFQTPTTGEALVPATKLSSAPLSGQLISTRDGGHTWHPVAV